MTRIRQRWRWRTAAWLAAVGLLGSCTQEVPEEREPTGGSVAAEGTQLPSQVSVAGIRGLRTRSTVVFESMPDAPHALTTVFAFPGRGFWRLQQTRGRNYRRRLVYRLGDEVLQVPPEESDSQPLEGGEARDLLLQMELRAAAMIWPDGHAWNRGADPNRVTLPGIGALEAWGSSAEEPPRRFVGYRPDGSELEALTEVEWERSRGRLWPRRWVLEMPDAVVWREEIEEVDASGVYSDGYFLPHDRLDQRILRDGDSYDTGVLLQIVIPARTVRRFPLPDGVTWMEAVTEARSLHELQVRELGPSRLDRGVELELSSSGRPVAIRLRLQESRDPAVPGGWERQESTRAASQLVREPPRIDAALVRRLRSSLADPDRAGDPYLYFDLGAAEPGGAGQLVVPADRHP